MGKKHVSCVVGMASLCVAATAMADPVEVVVPPGGDSSLAPTFVPPTCSLEHGLQDIAFTRFPDNPIIQPSTDRIPVGFWTDNEHTLHQCVVRKDLSSPYLMWYTGDSSDDYPRRIHLATSSDGIHFNKVGVVLQPGSPGAFDDVQVHMPIVLWHNNRWKMWYTGHKLMNCGPCSPEQSAGWNTIGYATSLDGINWTKHGRVLNVDPDLDAFDSDTVREPIVIFDEADGLFKMWYNGTRHGEHFGPTGYATSPDGVTWTRVAQVSLTEDRLRGGAIKIGDYIYMFYNIGGTLGWSVSRDGIEWRDAPFNPILTQQPGWEGAYLQAPSLVYDEPTGRLLMYYNAFDGVSEKIGGAWTYFSAITLPPSFVGDSDGDGDVDVTDFGALQRCLGESGVGSMPGGCEAMDLNCDRQISVLDVNVMAGCLSGPGLPASTECLNAP